MSGNLTLAQNFSSPDILFRVAVPYSPSQGERRGTPAQVSSLLQAVLPFTFSLVSNYKLQLLQCSGGCRKVCVLVPAVVHPQMYSQLGVFLKNM